ncbi:MAG TPA: cytochrome c oxidase subunit II, partial [Rhizobiales bacterium]|nr:cytochrome c oxidase subunit II [Hyphomicrobiales bacterium]
MRFLRAAAFIFASLFAAGKAMAAGLGKAEPWQLGLQQAASPTAESLHTFHNLLLWIIVS